MQVRLTRKLANYLDGIDVSEYEVGDLIELPVREAHLLIAEAWATPHIDAPACLQYDASRGTVRSVALPRPEAPRTIHTLERLREIRRQMEEHQQHDQERRRIEDVIREQLRDERSRIVGADSNRPKKSASEFSRDGAASGRRRRFPAPRPTARRFRE